CSHHHPRCSVRDVCLWRSRRALVPSPGSRGDLVALAAAQAHPAPARSRSDGGRCSSHPAGAAGLAPAVNPLLNLSCCEAHNSTAGRQIHIFRTARGKLPPSRKPHIVFIVLDTHRYDRLGAYGCTRGLTPNLDAFAGSATLFEHAVSPAQWTLPPHASLLRGELPTTHLTTQSGDMLDPAFRTLAVWLRCSGYDTTGYCNNPLVGVIDNGLTRGFNTFYNYGGAVPTTPASDLRRSLRLLS